MNVAGDPHNKEGKQCSRCDHVFTKNSITLTLTEKEGDYQVAKLVCAKCHHKHYELSE